MHQFVVVLITVNADKSLDVVRSLFYSSSTCSS